MRIECTDNKTFQLSDNGQLKGQLLYENLFSYKAKISLQTSDRYEIKPVGFFQTGINVAKNENNFANLQMNWKGQIVIAYQDGQEFLFKTMGVFNSKYLIENKQGEKLMQFDPHFDWKKFNYHYDVSYDRKPNELLVLIGVYAANYYIASMSGMI